MVCFPVQTERCETPQACRKSSRTPGPPSSTGALASMRRPRFSWTDTKLSRRGPCMLNTGRLRTVEQAPDSSREQPVTANSARRTSPDTTGPSRGAPGNRPQGSLRAREPRCGGDRGSRSGGALDGCQGRRRPRPPTFDDDVSRHVVSVLRNALVSETNSSLELYGITVFGRGFAETRNLDVLVAGHRTGAEPDFCRAMGPMVTRDSVLPSSAPTAAPMRFKRVRLVRGGSERESSRRSGATPCATERPLARRPRLGRRSRSHSMVCGSRSEHVDAGVGGPRTESTWSR